MHTYTHGFLNYNFAVYGYTCVCTHMHSALKMLTANPSLLIQYYCFVILMLSMGSLHSFRQPGIEHRNNKTNHEELDSLDFSICVFRKILLRLER